MTEAEVELAAIGWFQALTFNCRGGVEMDGAGEGADATHVLLEGRLAAALHGGQTETQHDPDRAASPFPSRSRSSCVSLSPSHT